MLIGTKTKVMHECEKKNTIRRVLDGRVDHRTFFRNIRGDILISGYGAANLHMLTDMVCEYMQRDDMPTVVLSVHTELFDLLRQRQHDREIARVMVSDPTERNYHPFYGMTPHQILRFIRLTAEQQGYATLIDQVLQYASAVLNIVALSYPVSLPAMVQLLQYDDDYISNYALQAGMGNMIADTIRANHEAGAIVRRICEKLENIFEDVYTSGTDTKYNFQSGAQGDVAVMAFYAVSPEQSVMNSYLREELFCTLKRTPKIRVVVDELPFADQEDELLQYLFQMKRQRKIELVFVSTNAAEACGTQVTFPNVLLFQHDDHMATEALSEMLWGKYLYHYPAPMTGQPPSLVFTLKKSMQWQIATEERLRVRAEDLYARHCLFGSTSDLAAVKTTANDTIYLIPASEFLPQVYGCFR